MASYEIFGIKVNGSHTGVLSANNNELHKAIDFLLCKKIIEKVVIKKTWTGCLRIGDKEKHMRKIRKGLIDYEQRKD